MKTGLKSDVMNILTTTLDGKKISAFVPGGTLEPHFEFEVEELMKMWVQITSIGSENIYFQFTDDAGVIREGFCKCL